MNIKPNCSLTDALDMIDRIGSYGLDGPRSRNWAIEHVAHVTGWPVGKLEAAIDRRYYDWCAQYGYDYT
jgi:hypothetical protein